MLTEILLTTLKDAFGGPVAEDMVLSAVASKPRTAGMTVIVPAPDEIPLRHGVPERPMILEAPGAGWYWTLTLSAPKLRFSLTRYVRWGAVHSIEWAALTDINRATLEPDPGAVPAWTAVLAEVQALVDQVPALASAAVAAEVTTRVDPKVSAAAASATAAAESAADALAVVESGQHLYVPETNVAGNVSLAGYEKNAFIHLRLTGNVVVTALPADPVPGMILTLEVRQDGTGGRTLQITGAAGAYQAPLALSSGADELDEIALIFDGARWKFRMLGKSDGVPEGWGV